MRESLKCLGFAGSRFNARNWATFALTDMSGRMWQRAKSYRTLMVGSHGAADSAGIPQSTMPGIDGGLRISRIFVSSWSSEELEAEGNSFEDSSGVSGGTPDWDCSVTMSSERCARG